MPLVEPLSREYDREHFDCGAEPLNVFLRQTARQLQDKGVSRTFVLTEEGIGSPKPVIGFFTLAATEGFTENLPADLAKRFPTRIPAIILARLAIAKEHQARGFDAILIAEALTRVAALAEQLGVAGLFVDAKDEPAAAFYRKHGFVPLVSDPLRLFLPLATIRSLIAK